MTYAPIPNEDVDVGSPLSTALMTALRDNPVEITQMADGAPILQNGWYPYNQTEIGGTGDGVYYDHAVDGSMNNIESPTFEAGYDYKIVASNLVPGASSRDLFVDLYGDAYGAFSSGAATVDSQPGGSSAPYALYEVVLYSPMTSKNMHGGTASPYYYSSYPNTTFSSNYSRYQTSVGEGFGANGTISTTVSKVRFRNQSYTFNSGTLTLLRRRTTG